MVSIYVTETGGFIKQQGGRILVGIGDNVFREVPIEKVGSITLLETIQVSSQAVHECLNRGIPITWMSTKGRYCGTLYDVSKVDVAKHRKQFELLDQKKLYLQMGKQLIGAKLKNQLTVIRRYGRHMDTKELDDHQRLIAIMRKKVDTADSIESLMGYEGAAGKEYFVALGKIVPESFSFQKRSKRPPKDKFNAMLSFGYTLLFSEMLAAVVQSGLHPFVGCLHSIKRGHPALVSDLMEEWRAPIIDSLVLSLVKRNRLDDTHFDKHKDGCYMTKEGRRLFLTAYDKKMLTTTQYKSSKAMTFRDCIVKQCQSFVSVILQEKNSLYEPFLIR